MTDQIQLDGVWVFNGVGAHFPAAVFSTKAHAEEWIQSAGVTGVLTRYPLDLSAYDWCVRESIFMPADDHQRQPEFIQQFSSAFRSTTTTSTKMGSK